LTTLDSLSAMLQNAPHIPDINTTSQADSIRDCVPKDLTLGVSECLSCDVGKASLVISRDSSPWPSCTHRREGFFFLIVVSLCSPFIIFK